MPKRMIIAAALALGTALPLAGQASEALKNLPSVTVYKNPWCGCCGGWIEHMRENGFEVTAMDVEDLEPVKASMKVPEDVMSCHTARIGDYVIEGHVPVADVIRLLDEGPEAIGLAVPGMVVGSPGMEQGNAYEPYEVILFGEGGSREVFARY